MKSHDLDSILLINEIEASVNRRESLDEVEARLSFDGSCTDELFGTAKDPKGLGAQRYN